MSLSSGQNNELHVDYDERSNRYDSHRRGGGPYAGTLLRLAGATPARDVLELGAGTGLNTASFLQHIPCRLTALEHSAGMLRQGRTKGLPVRWLRGSATALPFPAAHFDFLFSAYMLHHIADLDALFHESLRVLRTGGAAAFVTVSHEFIRAHPMNRYFPSFAAIDLARFQPVEVIVATMRNAGFQEVDFITDCDPPRPIDDAYADRVEHRFISTYDLLPPREFAAGLQQLRADLLAGGGRLEISIAREATTITGKHPPV